MLQSWVDVEGYAGRYSVSNTGLVRSNDRTINAGSGVRHKGLKFYGIKLHEAGITWDKMQEYIGRPEGNLSEVFKWQKEEERAVPVGQRR